MTGQWKANSSSGWSICRHPITSSHLLSQTIKNHTVSDHGGKYTPWMAFGLRSLVGHISFLTFSISTDRPSTAVSCFCSHWHDLLRTLIVLYLSWIGKASSSVQLGSEPLQPLIHPGSPMCAFSANRQLASHVIGCTACGRSPSRRWFPWKIYLGWPDDQPRSC